MMARRNYIYLLAILLLVVGCNKHEMMNFTFNATTEKPHTDNAKVHLVQEKWTYWDLNDQISIASNTSTQVETGTLVQRGGGGDDFNGVFESQLPDNSSKFLALFPHSGQNMISYSGGNFSATIDFPAVQPLESDTSFGINVAPMVAYCDGAYPFKMDFHSLFGIVRIQLFISANDDNYKKHISSITFKEVSSKNSVADKQISGLFTVNNFITYAPSLSPQSTIAENDKKITIPCGDKEFNVGDLLSFYLVLPAQAVEENGSTKYKLEMTVLTTENVQYVNTINVKVRRNGLTYMPAIGITAWGDVTNNNPGEATVSLTGNGTKDRPFKIYTAEDMQRVRDGIEAHKINQQPITEDTYFKVMRSDIVLDNTNWTSGIEFFIGHFIYASSASSTPGITNNSDHPIFKSILPGGEVVNLTVKSSPTGYSRTITKGEYYSPLCYTNEGTIRDCKVAAGSEFSLTLLNVIQKEDEAGVAGICVENKGMISGCGNGAKLNAQNHTVAGVCLFNKNGGIISGCYAVSPMEVKQSTFHAAGVCYKNEAGATVQDSYFSVNINEGVSNWGGIVHTNLGTVKNCFMDHAGIIKTTKSYGGIVNLQQGGVIDHCWNATDLAHGDGIYNGKGNGGLGGIVNIMSGGEIRNSYCDIAHVSMLLTSGNGGGIVGEMTGGTIRNCFAKFNIAGNGDIGSFVGEMSGGSIENCYGWDPLRTNSTFYGEKETENGRPAPVISASFNYGTPVPEGKPVPPGKEFNSTNLGNMLTSLNNWIKNTATNKTDYMTWEASAEAGTQPILTGDYYTPPTPTP